MAAAREKLRDQVDEWEHERDSLASFIPAVYLTDAGAPAIPPAHLRRIIEVLEDDSLGDTVIIAPPGSIKTNTLIAACAWWLGRDPTQHIGFFSNTDRQAYRRSVAVRDTITRNGKYAAIFPELLPDRGKGWAEYEWFVQRPDVGDKDASFMAAGVGSAIQGSRLDRGLLDDIADKKNMATELQREKVIEWLRDQVMTRRSPHSRFVMICTRWHESDPASWAISQGWRVIHLPALVRQEDGGYQSYWPSRWPLNRLACADDRHGLADPLWVATEEQDKPPCWVERDEDGRIVRQGNCWKMLMGSRAFALTFQGDVSPEEGAMFRREKWRRYQVLPAELDDGAIVIDTATDDKSTGDPFALAVWRKSGWKYYLERVYNRPTSFTDQQKVTADARARSSRSDRDPGLAIYIEEVPWSLPLITSMNEQVGRVVGVKPGGRSKVARAMAAVPYVEAGNVYLPEPRPGETTADFIARCGDVEAFIEQHAAFPNGAHDDMVDTTSLALFVLGPGAEPVPPEPYGVSINGAARPDPRRAANTSPLQQYRRTVTQPVKHVGGR